MLLQRYDPVNRGVGKGNHLLRLGFSRFRQMVEYVIFQQRAAANRIFTGDDMKRTASAGQSQFDACSDRGGNMLQNGHADGRCDDIRFRDGLSDKSVIAAINRCNIADNDGIGLLIR
ncbi:hypothetical protein D3C77_387920 [compost metagenome]